MVPKGRGWLSWGCPRRCLLSLGLTSIHQKLACTTKGGISVPHHAYMTYVIFWPMTFDSQHHDITRCHIRPWLSWGFTELAFGGLMVNCDLLKSSTHLFTEAGTTQKKNKKKHNLAILETYCICINYAYHIDLHARCIAMRRDTLELFWKFVFCLSSLEPAKYNLVSKFYGDNMWKIIWGALTSVLGFTEKIDPPIISKAPRLWFSIDVKISPGKKNS